MYCNYRLHWCIKAGIEYGIQLFGVPRGMCTRK